LDLSTPVPDVRTWRFWEVCDPRGEEELKRHLDEWDRQLREVHAGRREHLKTWNQLTYDLGAMTRDEHGRLRLDCKLGTHYHSPSTSECLDAALSEADAAWPDTTPEFTWPRLERRAWLHERVPDPVADGRHRPAAIGVSTLTIVRVRSRSFDGYKMFLSPRSVTVATQRRRYHVVPSGKFQPFIPAESADLLSPPTCSRSNSRWRQQRSASSWKSCTESTSWRPATAASTPTRSTTAGRPSSQWHAQGLQVARAVVS
jgi:hypothetical protein